MQRSSASSQHNGQNVVKKAKSEVGKKLERNKPKRKIGPCKCKSCTIMRKSVTKVTTASKTAVAGKISPDTTKVQPHLDISTNGLQNGLQRKISGADFDEGVIFRSSPSRPSTAATNRSSLDFEELKTSLNQLNKPTSQQKSIIDQTDMAFDRTASELIRSTLGSRLSKRKARCIQWKRGPLLGRGAYGKVWCGLTMSGRLIAVKQATITAGDFAKAQVAYENAQAEVALLKSLKHENIVAYLGTSLDDETISLFMEFVPGGTVSGVLQRFGPLDERVFARYTKQLVCAVEYLHLKLLVHRDIKGSNLMLKPDGCIKLIDFGCAKQIMNLGKINNDVLLSMKGTPNWMAPELITGAASGQSADIWSIGCVVIEMATGRPPWSHLNREATLFAITAAVSKPQMPSAASTDAVSFVNSCLNWDAESRPTASQLAKHTFLKISL